MITCLLYALNILLVTPNANIAGTYSDRSLTCRRTISFEEHDQSYYDKTRCHLGELFE